MLLNPWELRESKIFLTGKIIIVRREQSIATDSSIHADWSIISCVYYSSSEQWFVNIRKPLDKYKVGESNWWTSQGFDSPEAAQFASDIKSIEYGYVIDDCFQYLTIEEIYERILRKN
jgi:hypothetical protein